MNFKDFVRTIGWKRLIMAIVVVFLSLGLVSITTFFNRAANSVEQALHRVVAGAEWQNPITVEGYTPGPDEPMLTHFKPVSKGYFTTTGTALISGRDFDERDTGYVDPKRPPRVCIINEAFARKYFPDGRVLGRRVGVGNKPGTKPNIEIIGVVRNDTDEKPRDETLSEMFIPIDVSLVEPVV
jgi:hypothetical protein